ncbi:unnamed protein product [Amoebophrya sp. A25]|nr:unnamed protein product [Amoebophrya sp. A25]|eukprot:GSA25T00018613001.1
MTAGPETDVAPPVMKMVAGLYEDKADVQVGRLLERIAERQEWVAENEPWTEFEAAGGKVFFSNEDSEVQVSLQLPFSVEESALVVWFTERSMEVRILGDKQSSSSKRPNIVFLCRELYGTIDAEKSRWQLKSKGLKLKIALVKGQSGRSMDKWQKLRRL